jgi:hypothetical protein
MITPNTYLQLLFADFRRRDLIAEATEERLAASLVADLTEEPETLKSVAANDTMARAERMRVADVSAHSATPAPVAKASATCQGTCERAVAA